MPIINWTQYGFDQKVTFVYALIALFCSFILIMTYFINPKWRNELGSTKRIILIMRLVSNVYNI